MLKWESREREGEVDALLTKICMLACVQIGREGKRESGGEARARRGGFLKRGSDEVERGNGSAGEGVRGGQSAGARVGGPSRAAHLSGRVPRTEIKESAPSLPPFPTFSITTRQHLKPILKRNPVSLTPHRRFVTSRRCEPPRHRCPLSSARLSFSRSASSFPLSLPPPAPAASSN